MPRVPGRGPAADEPVGETSYEPAAGENQGAEAGQRPAAELGV
ncbi:MAG: hypothetical protein RIB46_20755 [Pseudomonadales bacterium]